MKKQVSGVRCRVPVKRKSYGLSFTGTRHLTPDTCFLYTFAVDAA
jgi:hypothetical protein